MRRRMSGLGRIVLIVLAAGLFGCSDPDPIRQYTVAKQTPADTFTPSPGAPASREPRQVAWFFKMLGPEAAVANQVEPFAKLVRSVQFDQAGKPRWTLPEGWTERQESGLRLATIEVPGDPKLEISVMALPSEDPKSAEYLLSNFNRWRSQLGLEDVDGAAGLQESRDRGEVQQMESGDQTLSLFNLSGKTAESGDSRMLAAMIVNGSTPAMTASTPPAVASSPAAPAREKPFTLTVPEGWKEAPLRTFQEAAFTAGEGEKPLSISIATAGGELTANVNRWRGQAALPEMTTQEINESAKSIPVDGIDAKYFVIDGEERSILGVIAPRNGTQWFIKADGPKALAQQERDKFEAFVKSIRFK
ncbi:hypothetical protein Pan44_45680 [Caulifigura coniformis]|uniref:Uncharacterized protein n=1 Tax=Caulifigura coniformis TaxID=2527983 RepID=A0A517SK60_9PLAN|nr:hypothetical protein [Caulifigura coniformis]QDT56513.1 hypothetical protein Pan44_45680 [Caulifigura coniformis]